jgi:hypothetical protein
LVTSTTGSALVAPAFGGTISLGSEASVNIPENALSGSQALTVSVLSESIPPAAPEGDAIISAYDFMVNGGGYAFQAPVTLTFTFNPSKIPGGTVPAVEYYDNTAERWVVVQGTVSGNSITVTVDHFTTFAVIAVSESPSMQTPTTPTANEPVSQTFSDVPLSYWAYDVIGSMSTAGYIYGYPDGTFRPGNDITRAEFASIMAKALDLSKGATAGTFTDVSAGDWYYNLVNAAVYAGLVSGMGNNLFDPGAPITREQMAVMVANALGTKAFPAGSTELNPYSDGSAVSSWAVTGVEQTIKAGIFSGMAVNILAPNNNATRAQAAAMIYKLLSVLGK